VANSDLLSVVSDGEFESVGGNILTSLTGDNFKIFADTGDDHMFETRVFTFSVFSQSVDIDVLVERLDTRERFSRSDIGEKVQLLSEGNVDGSVTLTDGGGEGTYERRFICG